MTRLFTPMMILALTLSSLNAHVHHNHKHEVSKSQIQQQAKIQLKLLVEGKKIDETFIDSFLASTEEKEFGKFTEWVVRFENKKMEDKTKQNLYIFLNLKGKVLGANYTGN